MQHTFDHVRISSIAGIYGSQSRDLCTTPIQGLDHIKQRKMLKVLGFEQIKVAPHGSHFSDMVTKVARKALDAAAVSPQDIDAIMTVSCSHDYLMPSTSFVVQEALGLPSTTMVLDGVNSCAGYVNALFHASTLIEHGVFKNILLCVGDMLHNYLVSCSENHLDGTQVANQMIFGDGAAATVLSYSDSIVHSHYQALSHGHLHHSLVDYSLPHLFDRTTDTTKSLYGMHIEGSNLSNYLFDQVVPCIRQVLSHESLTLDDISYAICHQGNHTMLKGLALNMDCSSTKIPFLAKNTGNLFSASIPVLLSANHKMLPDLRSKPTLISGFGVGLSVAVGLVDLTHTVICDIQEF